MTILRTAGFAFVVFHKRFHREPATVASLVMCRRDIGAAPGAACYQDGDHVVQSLRGWGKSGDRGTDFEQR